MALPCAKFESVLLAPLNSLLIKFYNSIEIDYYYYNFFIVMDFITVRGRIKDGVFFPEEDNSCSDSGCDDG